MTFSLYSFRTQISLWVSQLDNPLDDAFSWLVVILGIIAGALSQFPEQALLEWYVFPEQASQGPSIKY
jgi:hypothetical protein